MSPLFTAELIDLPTPHKPKEKEKKEHFLWHGTFPEGEVKDTVNSFFLKIMQFEKPDNKRFKFPNMAISFESPETPPDGIKSQNNNEEQVALMCNDNLGFPAPALQINDYAGSIYIYKENGNIDSELSVTVHFEVTDKKTAKLLKTENFSSKNTTFNFDRTHVIDENQPNEIVKYYINRVEEALETVNFVIKPE